MLRNTALLTMLILTTTAISSAGRLESRIEERWRGAWVIIDAEVRSDCDARYTDNRINGRLSQSGGRYWFRPGELAQVEKIDVNRSRVDVRVTLEAALRVSWQDGPFTLYDHVSCRVELEVEVPRSVVREREAAELNRHLTKILEPHETFAAARASTSWSGREPDPFPEDYGRTLALYEIFKVERHNTAVARRIDEARDRLEALSNAVSPGEEYVLGFTVGVAEQRGVQRRDCPALVETRFAMVHRRGRRSDPQPSDEWLRGFNDGRSLVYHLDVLSRAADCYLPLPEPPQMNVRDRPPDSSSAYGSR
jgi:hypothetical protein